MSPPISQVLYVYSLPFIIVVTVSSSTTRGPNDHFYELFAVYNSRYLNIPEQRGLKWSVLAINIYLEWEPALLSSSISGANPISDQNTRGTFYLIWILILISVKFSSFKGNFIENSNNKKAAVILHKSYILINNKYIKNVQVRLKSTDRMITHKSQWALPF